jgi:hypothetical protein
VTTIDKEYPMIHRLSAFVVLLSMFVLWLAADARIAFAQQRPPEPPPGMQLVS